MSYRLGVDVGGIDRPAVAHVLLGTTVATDAIVEGKGATVSTSGCVRASATDALQHGFRPVVVGDACGDRTAAIHQANLADLQAKYADLATVSEAAERLAAR